MSVVVAVVDVRAVLVIVGFDICACILCVQDMYASLDHHTIHFQSKRWPSRGRSLEPPGVCALKATCMLFEAKDFKKAVEIFTNMVSVVAFQPGYVFCGCSLKAI